MFGAANGRSPQATSLIGIAGVNDSPRLAESRSQTLVPLTLNEFPILFVMHLRLMAATLLAITSSESDVIDLQPQTASYVGLGLPH
jgi:hypothetical protein